MLKHITVNIVVDDHEPEKCGKKCEKLVEEYKDEYYCTLFNEAINGYLRRCRQCVEEAK